MDPNIHPELAADLSGAKDNQAADLSKEAIAARARQAKLEEAAGWARSMNRTFKGISRLTRRDYAELAVEKYDLMEKD